MRIFIMTVLAILMSSVTASAEFYQYQTGAYYQMGCYNGNPIIWRYVSTDDENGMLMVSDKILCFKAANAGEKKNIYGDGFWEYSTIRTWLNSTADAGYVEWTNNYPPDYEHLKVWSGSEINYPYADEQGFLNKSNFSESECSVMKTITQWQALPKNKLVYCIVDI